MSALGSLVVKLALEYAQFSQGLSSTEQEVKQHAKRVQDAYEQMSEGVSERMGRLKGAVLGALAGAVSVGGLVAAMSKIKQETMDAEQEQNQLAAAIKSTGASAGWSQERLNDMAAALAKNSNFSEGLINQAQTRLLTYTGIVGKEFPRAMQAIVDMSARLGTEVTASAETIGKALDIPSEGLTALTKQGFKFTDEQKELVKQLERAGRVGEAQGVILQSLESAYEGAAKAARESFGGAMNAVGETLNSLMTADSASLPGLRASVEGLNETLNSDDVRQGFQALVGSLVDIGTFAARSAAEVISLGQTVAEHKDEIAILLGALAGAGTAAGAMKVAAAIGGAGGIVGAIGKVRAAFMALTVVMAMNPAGLLLLGIGAATGAAIAMNMAEPTGDKLTKEIEYQADRLAKAEALLAKAGGPKKNFTEKLEARIVGIRDHLETLRTAAGLAKPEIADVAGEVAGVAEAAEGTGTTLRKSEDWIKKYGTAAEKAAVEVAEWKKKLGAAFTPEMQRQIEATYAKQDAGARAGAQSAKQLEAAYTGLTSSIEQKIAEQKLELESGEALNDADKMRIKFQQDLGDSLKGLTAAQRASIEAGLKEYDELIKENAARKKALELLAEERKYRQEWWAAQAKTVEELEAGNKSMRDEIALIGLSAEQQSAVLRQREEAILLTKEQHLAELQRAEDASGFMSRERIMLEQEIELRRERLDLMSEKGAREASKTAADLVKSDWEEASKTMGSTLSDYIMGGGKDAAQYLKRLFSTLTLQPLVQYGANSAMGLLGMGQQGKDVQSVLGGNNVGTTVMNNAGLIGAGYQAAFGASVGASSASMFGANAVGLAGGDALGALIAGNGMWAGVATGAQATAQAAVAANLALEAGTAVALEAGTLGTAIGTGATGAAAGASSMMSGVMAAAPYLAAAVALYAIIAGMDDSGTPHSGAGAVYSKVTGVQSGAEIYNQSTFGMGHRDEYSEDMQAGISGIAQGLGQTLDSFAVSFGKTAGYSVATAFADDSSKDGSWGSLKIADELGKVLVNWEDSRASKWAPREFADGEDGYKEYLKAVAVDVKSAFLAMDLPAWANQALKAATDIDTLTAALQQIATVKSVLDGLGKTMSMFADLSGDLQTRLLAASGGVEALASNAQTFYESFFTDRERALKQRELQMAALGRMGLYIDPAEGDAAAAAFRKTVEDAMKSGQVELAAQLMAMSGDFKQTADYAQGVLADMELAAKSAAEAASKAAADVIQAAAEAAAKAAEVAQAGRETAADSAWANVQAAIDREKKYWSEIAGASQTAITALSGSLSLLTSNARELYGTVDSVQQMLAAQGMVYIENALNGVRGGASAADFTGLQDAIGASRSGISAGVYVSDFERQRDTLVLAGQLSELGELTDSQLSVEQRTLDAAQEQIKQLDVTLDYWQQQVDGTAQLIDTGLSIESAISALGVALAAREAGRAAAAGGGGGGGGGGGSSGGIASDSMLKAVGDAWAAGDWITAQNYIRGQGISNDQLQGAFDLNYADLRYLFEQGITTQNPGTYSFKATTPEGVYSEAKAQGLSLLDVNAILGAGPGEAEEWAKKMGLPIFHEGTNYVPRTGFAVLQEGEQVVRRGLNPYAGGVSPQSSNSELIAEVRAVGVAVAALVSAGDRTAKNTDGLPQLVRLIDRVTAGGNAVAMEMME